MKQYFIDNKVWYKSQIKKVIIVNIISYISFEIGNYIGNNYQMAASFKTPRFVTIFKKLY